MTARTEVPFPLTAPERRPGQTGMVGIAVRNCATPSVFPLGYPQLQRTPDRGSLGRKGRTTSLPSTTGSSLSVRPEIRTIHQTHVQAVGGGCFWAFLRRRKFRRMPTAVGKAMANSATMPVPRNQTANSTAAKFAFATNRRDTQSFLIDKIDR